MPKADKDLSELARQLLSAERTTQEPALLQERALARARRTVEEGRWGERRLLVGGRSAWRARVRGGALLGAAALAMAGLAAAGVGLLQAPPEAAPPVSPLPKPVLEPTPPSQTVATAPLAPPPSVQPPGKPLPPPRIRAPQPAASASTDAAVPASVRQYAIELALLEPARSGIARGDYAGALTALLRHRREFPAGQLAEERSALQVRALWGMGRTSEAEAAAAAFRQRYPRSALLSWMNARRAPTP